MKVKSFVLMLLLLIVYPAFAQTATVNLSWTAPTTLVNGTPLAAATVLTYNIYRGTKPDCSDCVKINTGPISATTYADVSVASGKIYYYAATAVLTSANLESAKSAALTVDLSAVPTAPPTGMKYLIVVP